ncbi:hypothetical protein KY342_04665 [Candidatus Woesearchaeota archaeon]|nr:hypothetical protein [Candidatus Woesearchaeota archaeon]
MGLEDLVGLEDGVRFYIEHLRENEENSSPITNFYRRFDTEKQKLLLRGSWGQLNKYYNQFKYSKIKKKLPKGVETFEDWIKQQIPKRLKKQLERLIEKYFPKKEEYILEEGVKFYIQHLKDQKEKSLQIKPFYRRLDSETKKLLKPGKIGQLHKYFSKFRWQRNRCKIQKNLTFEDWIKLQIPSKLKRQLEQLTEKHLTKEEYTLEEGVKFYIQHLKQNKENSSLIATFYERFNTEEQKLFPHGKIGKLNRYYAKFCYLKNKIKIPKNITFENWVKSQISLKLKRQLEQLTEKYLTKEEYSLEQGVEYYINHLRENEEKSKPIKTFYRRFDTEERELLPEGKTGQLGRYHDRFRGLKRKNKLSMDTTFEDWVKQQISSKLRKQLEQLTEKYLKNYILEQGVEFYIEHLKQNKENSSPIISFFIMFDTKNNIIFNNKKGKLSKYYRKFNYLKKQGNLRKNLTFEDYLLQNLPEEKRERAEYYLKGQYLADLIDRRKLKQAVLVEV